jgi:hypothetical protein
MTYFQIFSSIIGIGFLVGGFLFVKNSKMWGLIFIIIGGWLMNKVLFGDISLSDEKQEEIKELKAEEINSIFILPSKSRKVLTKDTLQIKEDIEIKKILDCLSKTEETLRTNQISDWGCILKIEKVNRQNVFARVSKKENQTLLELYSNGEYGVNYGTMINNELGFLIEEIIWADKK